MMIMSLKWRMALLTTLVLVIILVAFNSFVYLVFMQTTIQTERANLTTEVVQLKDRWREGNTTVTTAKQNLTQTIGKRQMVRFVTDNGTELFRVSNNFRTFWFPKNIQSTISGGVYLIDDEHILVVQKAAVLQNQSGMIQIVENVQDLDRSIGFVFGLLVTGSVGALLLTVAGGYWLSERWLRPVREIIGTVRSIGGGELDRRLQEPATRDEIGELTRTFNAMLARIELAFGRQRQFVADASHELRTPIAILEGYANMLRRWGKEDPTIRNEAVGAIVLEAARLRGLTNHLLDLASSEHPELLERETVSVWDSIERVCNSSAILNPNVHLTWGCLSAPNECLALINDQSLDRVLTALIDNAFKYTPDGGKVHLSCCMTETQVVVTVSDTGMGIPFAETERVFERFYRVDKSRNRERGGAGLGLSICKEIVSRCGGNITLTSAVGEGTTVTVELPQGKGYVS